MLDAQFGGLQGDGCFKINNHPLSHYCNRLESVPFTALPQDSFEYFEQAQGRYDEPPGIFDGFGEKAGIGPVGEILQPRCSARHLKVALETGCIFER